MARLFPALLCAAWAFVGAGARAHQQEIADDPVDSPFESHAACQDGLAAGRPCWNVHLESFVPLAALGATSANDIWGWTDPQTGVEYALVGLRQGTAFVDLSDPHHPVRVGNLRSATFSSAWRDVKVYGDHAFIVSEARGHGLQVFDLKRLRAVADPPVAFSADAVYRGFGRAHNIAINEATGFAYVVGSDRCLGGLYMLDVADPRVPGFAGCYFGDGYTHDAQCVVYAGPDAAYRGREICFNANEDTLTIVDVTDKGDPVLLSRTHYTGSGYTHQGWITDDHAYFLLDDEFDELRQGIPTRTYVWNVGDLDAPVVTGSHDGSSQSIDHNQYVVGNHVFQANYLSGVRILRLGDLERAELAEVAYFDTAPDDDRTVFAGVWSVYPFFASGIVVASDISRGLFVLEPDLAAVAECEDGVDNDRDGRRDHPDDPTCVAADDASESLRLDVAIEVRPRSRQGLDPERDRWVEVAVLPTDSVAFGQIDPASLAFGRSAVAPLADGLWNAFRRTARERAAALRGQELRLRFPVVPADYGAGAGEPCLTGSLAGDPFVACDAVPLRGAAAPPP